MKQTKSKPAYVEDDVMATKYSEIAGYSSEENKKKKPESKYYIFGDLFGRMMAKSSLKFQYESSMMGYALLICSLIFYIVYELFFTTGVAWYWKTFVIFNCACGILILWSTTLTTLQQYSQYMEINNSMKGGLN